jgi:hypothetical protein
MRENHSAHVILLHSPRRRACERNPALIHRIARRPFVIQAAIDRKGGLRWRQRRNMRTHSNSAVSWRFTASATAPCALPATVSGAGPTTARNQSACCAAPSSWASTSSIRRTATAPPSAKC